MKGIYKITNVKNGKIYVGRSKDILRRFGSHLQQLRNGKHANEKLQADFIEFGTTSFSFEILEECLMRDINERETFWIQTLDSMNQGYNKIEKDEDIFEPSSLSIREQYAKKALDKIIKDKSKYGARITRFDDEEMLRDLLEMFDQNIDLIREDYEVFVIPNSFKELRRPPYVFLENDFR